jgi:putative endonuclease
MKHPFVYIMASKSLVLYIWVTSNLEKRVFEHKHWLTWWFTKKYNVNCLVYYEQWDEMLWVIMREKQLKWWTRKKKMDLINKINPSFEDLSLKWE